MSEARYQMPDQRVQRRLETDPPFSNFSLNGLWAALSYFEDRGRVKGVNQLIAAAVHKLQTEEMPDYQAQHFGIFIKDADTVRTWQERRYYERI